MTVPVDPWSYAERVLAERIARILDDATIAILRLTSSGEVLARVATEEVAGVPTYDQAPLTQPRDPVGRCVVCGRVFWGSGTGTPRRFCASACQQVAYWHADPELSASRRERDRLRKRARYAARRADPVLHAHDRARRREANRRVLATRRTEEGR